VIGEQRWLRLAFTVGLFEMVMPFVGVLIGIGLAEILAGLGRFVAAALLFAVGVWFILEGRHKTGASRITTKGKNLYLVALTVSLDEVAVGASLGLLGLPVLILAPSVGVQAFLFSVLGTRLGGFIRSNYVRTALWAAGLVLILIAVIEGVH